MSDYNADKVRQLAAKYLNQIEPLERLNFSTYKRKDDADDDLKELCMTAHGDNLPDDYKYNYIVDALELIADSSTDELQDLDGEIESDVYNSDLLKWLSSNLNRAEYVNEYVRELGLSGVTDSNIDVSQFDLFVLLSNGQWKEKTEVFQSVLSSLIELANQLEDEDDTDEDEE